MNVENKREDPGKNSREKAGTRLPPIVTPPVPPVPNRAHTEMKQDAQSVKKDKIDEDKPEIVK